MFRTVSHSLIILNHGSSCLCVLYLVASPVVLPGIRFGFMPCLGGGMEAKDLIYVSLDASP
jgi:hypothetical protein